MSTRVHYRRICTFMLSLTCLAAGACDDAAVSSNIHLDDAELEFREAAFDCELWLAERGIEHPTEEDIDIDLNFAELGYDNGFADLRACEDAYYDREPNGDWVIYNADEDDVTWDLGLRNGDRNVMLRPIDADTGRPKGKWVPLAFPEISAQDLIELYDESEFELRVEREVGEKIFWVHLR